MSEPPNTAAVRDTTAASIERERALNFKRSKSQGVLLPLDISFWYESLPVAVVLVSSWDCRASSSCGLPTLDFTFGINFLPPFRLYNDQDKLGGGTCL
jgi:hypothetical protein